MVDTSLAFGRSCEEDLACDNKEKGGNPTILSSIDGIWTVKMLSKVHGVLINNKILLGVAGLLLLGPPQKEMCVLDNEKRLNSPLEEIGYNRWPSVKAWSIQRMIKRWIRLQDWPSVRHWLAESGSLWIDRSHWLTVWIECLTHKDFYQRLNDCCWHHRNCLSNAKSLLRVDCRKIGSIVVYKEHLTSSSVPSTTGD